MNIVGKENYRIMGIHTRSLSHITICFFFIINKEFFYQDMESLFTAWASTVQ